MFDLLPYCLDLTDKQKEVLESTGVLKLVDYANWKKHHFRAKTDFELIVRKLKNWKKEIIPERGLMGQGLCAYLIEKEPVESYVTLKEGFVLARDPLYVKECQVGDKTYLLYFINSVPTMSAIKSAKQGLFNLV